MFKTRQKRTIFTTETYQLQNHEKMLNGNKCMVINELNHFKKTRQTALARREWYDNEWGYSNKTVDLIQYISTVK